MTSTHKDILVTGSSGFIGSNLTLALKEKGYNVLTFNRNESLDTLRKSISPTTTIIHLAGENRPDDTSLFKKNNKELTERLCEILKEVSFRGTLLFSSTIHADKTNEYGISKKAAEDALINTHKNLRFNLKIYRLPGIFGKWSKPNYNSVVSTFCHNVANDIDIEVHDPQAEIALVYIDDLVNEFLNEINQNMTSKIFQQVEPIYNITIQKLADTLNRFKLDRNNQKVNNTANGFERALYATFLSYIPIHKASYLIEKHEDDRGIFSEVLKTSRSGQFSFFTAKPGITRGGHYHNTKNEKFLVLNGSAKFNFQHIVNKDVYCKEVSSDYPEIVETIPGWAHDITNTGECELIVMLWANEIFEPEKADTIFYEIQDG